MNSALTWSRVCHDPNLRDLPFKVELNERGILEMSPARPRHGEFQSEIVFLLKKLLRDGRVITECPVLIGDVVRVPDVAWIQKGRELYNEDETALTVAPDICVEVLSENNTEEEMNAKRRLYSERGCREFWTCADDGTVRFMGATSGESLPSSELCSEFPSQIKL